MFAAFLDDNCSDNEENEESIGEDNDNIMSSDDHSIIELDSSEDELSPIKTMVAFDSATRHQLKKTLSQATKTSGVAYRSDVFYHEDLCYMLGITPHFNTAWMIQQKVIQGSVRSVLQMKNPSKEHEWTDTIEEICIRAVPHGDNRYKRDKRKVFKRFIWITAVPKKEEHKLVKRVILQGQCIYSILKNLCENNMLEGVANVLREEATQDDNGHWGGLYGYFMNRTSNRGHEAVSTYITKECLKQFQDILTFQKEPIHFDQFLTDYDIRRLAEKYVYATSWDSVNQNVRKVFYKNNWKLSNIPTWDKITAESRL